MTTKKFRNDTHRHRHKCNTDYRVKVTWFHHSINIIFLMLHDKLAQSQCNLINWKSPLQICNICTKSILDNSYIYYLFVLPRVNQKQTLYSLTRIRLYIRPKAISKWETIMTLGWLNFVNTLLYLVNHLWYKTLGLDITVTQNTTP